MSDAGANPHLEGIISDFEGLSFIFCISLNPSVYASHLSECQRLSDTVHNLSTWYELAGSESVWCLICVF